MRLLKLLLPALLCLPLVASAQTAKHTPAAKAPAAKSATPDLPILGIGKKDAPMVIETFTDYQCPPCRQYYLTTLRRLIEEYCYTGKVYLLHHDYPWQAHQFSHQAARWAIAGAAIGKFETVSEALYSKQDTWAAAGAIEPVVAAVLTPDELKKLKDVMTARSAAIDAQIESDLAVGKQVGVNQTPSTKVTYKGAVVAPLTGGIIQYAILKHFIDEQLAK